MGEATTKVLREVEERCVARWHRVELRRATPVPPAQAVAEVLAMVEKATEVVRGAK